MDHAQPTSQFADGCIEVIQTERGVQWRICSGGVCLTDGSGLRLLERYEALLISQGKRVPPG